MGFFGCTIHPTAKGYFWDYNLCLCKLEGVSHYFLDINSRDSGVPLHLLCKRILDMLFRLDLCHCIFRHQCLLHMTNKRHFLPPHSNHKLESLVAFEYCIYLELGYQYMTSQSKCLFASG